jgi:hypothetical protein
MCSLGGRKRREERREEGRKVSGINFSLLRMQSFLSDLPPRGRLLAEGSRNSLEFTSSPHGETEIKEEGLLP